jgi:hypothetical protein
MRRFESIDDLLLAMGVMRHIHDIRIVTPRWDLGPRGLSMWTVNVDVCLDR